MAILLMVARPSNRPFNAIVLGMVQVNRGLRANVANAFLCEGMAAIIILTFFHPNALRFDHRGKGRGTWLPLMVTTMGTEEIVRASTEILLACRPYVAAHAAATILPALFLGAGRSRVR